jgi:hypothetical protein
LRGHADKINIFLTFEPLLKDSLIAIGGSGAKTFRSFELQEANNGFRNDQDLRSVVYGFSPVLARSVNQKPLGLPFSGSSEVFDCTQ